MKTFFLFFFHQELFGDVGPVRKVHIRFDRSGRSNGTAEVYYTTREDARVAAERYNNAQLDGTSQLAVSNHKII